MTTTPLKPEPKRRTTDHTPEGPDFAEVVNLLAVLSEAASRLAEIEADANSELLTLIDEHKGDYAQCQQKAMEAETALEILCRRNPDWFKTAKSIKTPYGKVAFRSGTRLEVKDEEAAVKLIRAIRPADADDFIRTVEVPNVEALEKLDDAELARYLIKRVSADAFSATPAKVDFGKAVKEAAAKDN